MRPLRMRAEATAEADQGRVIMGTLIWANILLMLLFFGCWVGIPLWHTLRALEQRGQRETRRAGGESGPRAGHGAVGSRG